MSAELRRLMFQQNGDGAKAAGAKPKAAPGPLTQRVKEYLGAKQCLDSADGVSARKCVIAWNPPGDGPDAGKIAVAEHPEGSGAITGKLKLTWGSFKDGRWETCSKGKLLFYLMDYFRVLVVEWHLDPAAVHEAFLQLDEYREFVLRRGR